MKKKLIAILIILLITTIWIMGQSDWHLTRNNYNQLPKGQLIQVSEIDFVDENHLLWEIQPHYKNAFHQPEARVEPIEQPYPTIIGIIEFDEKNPNLKFLCEVKTGGSYEAIMTITGEYLIDGPQQGTYNYSHPVGILGNIKHAILDVLPHFVNSNYKNKEK